MVQLPCSAYSGHITSEPLLSTVTRLCTKWTEWYNVSHTIFWKKHQLSSNCLSHHLFCQTSNCGHLDLIKYVLVLVCFTMCKSISRNPATSAKIWPLHDVRIWVGTLGRAYIANAADSGMGWVAVSDCHRSLSVLCRCWFWIHIVQMGLPKPIEILMKDGSPAGELLCMFYLITTYYYSNIS